MTIGGDPSPGLDLRGYALALWRRKIAVILCLVTVVGSAMLLSYRKTPEYRATAQILLQARIRDLVAGVNTNVYVDPIRAQKTEMQILASPPVRAEVEKRIGPGGGVSARPLTDTDIVLVDAVATSPTRAATVVNTYVDAYITYRQAQSVEELAAAGTAVQSKISDLQKQIDAINANAPALRPGDPARPANPQLDALLAQLAVLKQKADSIQLNSSLASGDVQMVAPALPPAAPFTPSHKRDLALALAVGVMLGVGVALLWEFLDDSIDSKEELSRLAPDVPILATVPAVKSWKDRTKPYVVSLDADGSPAAEAYRSLRTSIHFANLEKQIALIQVTSPSPAEGKTATIANLGVALARAGSRVVIVCCDLRRPRVHTFFGLKNDIGFVSVMLGDATLSDALQNVPEQPRLVLLAAGPPPPNPSELLSSTRASDLFDVLRKNADVVLIDCPPLLPVTDAAVLSGKVDATLLVVSAGTTTRRRLNHSVELLRQVDAPLIGTVLNGVAAEGGYGYTYSRGAESPPVSGPSRRNRNGHGAASNGNGNGSHASGDLSVKKPTPQA